MASLEARHVESAPWEVIAVDHAGSLARTSDGKEYILIVVDMFSGYPEAIPVSSLHAETTTKALLRVFDFQKQYSATMDRPLRTNYLRDCARPLLNLVICC